MKPLPLCIWLALIATAGRAAETHVPTLALGASAPAFSLPGIDGKTHALGDYAQAKILAIVFTCNHCPTAQLYEKRIQKLADDYKDRGVTLVAIQPNDPKALRLDELGYTDVSDSFEEMKIRAAYRHFRYPYLYDGETQAVAKAYGPAATPHVFLFDSERKLRYEGRVDDSQRESLVKRRDARVALDEMLAGKPVSVTRTPSVGCSTKWAYKQDTRVAEKKRYEAEPVTVKEAGAAELSALKRNPTDKVTVVSFWATWCGPCLEEMSQLVEIFHMYRHRPFDVVSVSINYPDERKGVLDTLQKQHASYTNLHFSSTDTYALMKAFDADWNGAVPFTMVLAPGGKVLWRYQGEPDLLELKRTVLSNLPDDTYVGQQAYWSFKD